MRKHHSKKSFDKLKSFSTFIVYHNLTNVDDIWVQRLKELEYTMSEFDEVVGMFTDDRNEIYKICSPGMMGKFNNWWKDALRDSLINV